jgi:HPt (histidine-containing phosphotransfer) domain-containing protein
MTSGAMDSGSFARRYTSLDYAAALDRVGGDAGLLREIARLFLGQAPELLEQIRAAAAGQDAERLYRAAHTLKGSIGNFAADSAFAAAREVEMIGRRGELASAGDALAALESELGRLGADLNALYRDGG